MNSENCFKKIYLLIFVFVMMVANVGAEPTAYAEYQDGVLVFRYGEKNMGVYTSQLWHIHPFKVQLSKAAIIL